MPAGRLRTALLLLLQVAASDECCRLWFAAEDERRKQPQLQGQRQWKGQRCQQSECKFTFQVFPEGCVQVKGKVQVSDCDCDEEKERKWKPAHTYVDQKEQTKLTQKEEQVGTEDGGSGFQHRREQRRQHKVS